MEPPIARVTDSCYPIGASLMATIVAFVWLPFAADHHLPNHVRDNADCLRASSAQRAQDVRFLAGPGHLATGPGVADMKSGLVMNSFVLEAFQRFGGAPCPLVGLYTSDEEIASPSSRPIIEAEARQARAVFNSEPGRPTGNVVSQRKGAAFLELAISRSTS